MLKKECKQIIQISYFKASLLGWAEFSSTVRKYAFKLCTLLSLLGFDLGSTG